MKRILLLIFCIPFVYVAQTYTHPTVGIQSEYVGACEVATCSGTYTDNGGAGGNYALSVNAIYRTFCPNTAGMCMKVTFNSYAMEGKIDPPGPNPLDCYYDYLTIGNGPTQNSTLFTTAPASASGRICGTPAVPFSYTSTHASGCLTFRFTSDASVAMAGWSATLSCVPCAGGPTGTTNADCPFATPICGNSGNAGNASGPGIMAEGCSGASCPAGGENHSNWYTFTILTSGTLAFNIVPSTATDDYDFALYGPGTLCGALGAPIRCSDAGTTGNTGMAAGNLDLTENVLGNGYVSPLNVTAGQTYYMVVDEWTPTGAGYNLNFTGTATFNCIVLPIELMKFEANYVSSDNIVDLNWTTQTETNNDYFTVEKSVDGSTYVELMKVKAVGNSATPTQYMAFDANPTVGNAYYRLKQTDLDGKNKYSAPALVSVNKGFPEEQVIVHPNPSYSTVNVSYSSDQRQVSTILIYDYTGKTVYESSVKSEEGINSELIDISALPRGVYLVAVISNGKLSKTRLCKE